MSGACYYTKHRSREANYLKRFEIRNTRYRLDGSDKKCEANKEDRETAKMFEMN